MRTSPRGRPATAAPETPSRHARPPPSLARRGCVRTPSPGFHEHGRRPRRGGGPFSHHDKNLRRCPWFEAPDGRPSKRDCRQPTTFHVVVATSNAVVRPRAAAHVRRPRPGRPREATEVSSLPGPLVSASPQARSLPFKRPADGQRNLAPRRRRLGQRGWHRARGHIPEGLPSPPAPRPRSKLSRPRPRLLLPHPPPAPLLMVPLAGMQRPPGAVKRRRGRPRLPRLSVIAAPPVVPAVLSVS